MCPRRCLQEAFVGGIGCGHDWWGIRNSTKQWHPFFRCGYWHPLFCQGVVNGTGSKLWVVCWEEPLVERVREQGVLGECVLVGSKLCLEQCEYPLLFDERHCAEG